MTTGRTGRRIGIVASGVLFGLLGALGWAAGAGAAELSSAWHDGFNHRTRITAAEVPAEAAETGSRLYAFVEIEMPHGWKTYWKSPGESGVPPAFDWSQATNVKSADVLYPAPRRLADKGGDVIGYKDHVIFPVAIERQDTSAPTSLKVVAQFGICKDICVPAEATLVVDVAPGEKGEATEETRAALAAVPRRDGHLKPTDPVLVSSRTTLVGEKPRLIIQANVPGGTEGMDVFFALPDGSYFPPARKTSENGADVTFEVDLSADVDLEALKKTGVSATLVSMSGASAYEIKVE